MILQTSEIGNDVLWFKVFCHERQIVISCVKKIKNKTKYREIERNGEDFDIVLTVRVTALFSSNESFYVLYILSSWDDGFRNNCIS